MTPAARIQAAIEVLTDLIERKRPAPDALKDWGLSHRFAGSKDRASIASLVYDTLRRRSSAAWLMGAETPRAVMAGALRLQRGMDPAGVVRLFSGERHAPDSLSDEEQCRLAGSLDEAPEHVRADAPEWIWPSMQAAFGENAVEEVFAFSARAPIDIRVNELKTTRKKLMAELAHLNPEETPYSLDGLRFQPSEDGRGPSLQTEKAFLDGLFEVQDEGSQLAARLSLASPSDFAVDLCAGAGGKTLSLAALMENRGQIIATENDSRRLTPLYERVTRSGARNVQVRSPKLRNDDAVADIDGLADLVFVDAPCTGSGTWRRNPDAKWRLRPGALAERIKDQTIVLDRAARLVKKGGRIAYITCSLLPEENDDAIEAFLARHTGFEVIEPGAVADKAGLGGLASFTSHKGHGLQLTALRCGTDGF
ncbi:MAG: RsmB/NOP family class I SAM-dependent RNA methyltransferase [Hyphomicrobiales bacterium]|nr:RsmB/NOP family class I SAM-dependent RNA methyltransferase [Hyphomicrobiales bacterium]